MASEKRGRSHQTQWAAQFAVASELCRRGYEVALTMGNHPSVDIMAVSRNGVRFDVDVKGAYTRNHWIIKPKPARVQLFYILAFVPDPKAGHDEPNEFFILTQEQVNAEIASNDARCVERAAAKGKVLTNDPFQGIPFVMAKPYRDWKILPQ